MSARKPVGIAAAVSTALIGGTEQRQTLHVFVVCDDGTAWLWAPEPAQTEEAARAQELRLLRGQPVNHTWVQYHQPIPGTTADEEYKREG